MSEQPSPEPQKPKADAAPKPAASSPRAEASGAQAYVPLPGKPAAKGKGVLLLAALVVAGALAGTASHFIPKGVPPPVVAAAPVQNKVLVVTDADMNAAATERVRKSPAPAAAVAGAVAAAGMMGSGGGSPAPAAPVQQAALPVAAPAVPAAAAPASSPLPVAPPELVAPAPSAPHSILTPQAQRAVQNDGWSIFSMRLVDDVDQDGDVVQILIDGVPMSYLSLTHAGATLEIPLKKGESHKITVLAVRDGVGGVTLGLQTTAGMVVSRRMAVGESDSWIIDYK